MKFMTVIIFYLQVKSANVVRQYARIAAVQAQLFAESQNGVTASSR